MDCFPLSIPHLVVSSKQTLEEDLELHVLTPFGHMDISFSAISPWRKGKPCLDIRVEGDTAFWKLDRALPPTFRTTIFEFVGFLALRHTEWPLGSLCKLYIRFLQESGGIHLTGRLMPYASAIADG